MRRRFRVENLTVNLAERVKIDELLCFKGTINCFGRTVLCLWPSQCCGPFWSNPGGGGNLSGGCGIRSITITDCPQFTLECARFVSDGGCGVNFSTCPGGSVWDFDDIINVFDDLQVELNELVAEIDAKGPELRAAAGPATAAEFDAAEAEVKAAMDRLQAMRKEKGV